MASVSPLEVRFAGTPGRASSARCVFNNPRWGGDIRDGVEDADPVLTKDTGSAAWVQATWGEQRQTEIGDTSSQVPAPGFRLGALQSRKFQLQFSAKLRFTFCERKT